MNQSDMAVEVDVSVIIPTFRRTELVIRAINSVLNQTLQNFEIIVVDDASGDGTPEVVAAVGDPRIRYVRHDANRGLAAARNTGVKHAKSDLIAFLDDDDEYLPGYLSATCDRLRLEPRSVAFVACGVREITERGATKQSRDVVPPQYAFTSLDQAYRQFLTKVPFSGWFITIWKCVFNEIGGFDEEMRTEQDRDLLYRLVQRYQYAVSSDVLAVHHFHSGPHVNVYGPKKAQAFRKILSKNKVTLASDRSLWASWHYKLGWLHYMSGDPKLGRRFLWQEIRAEPLSLQMWWAFFSYGLFGKRASVWHAAISRWVKARQ